MRTDDQREFDTGAVRTDREKSSIRPGTAIQTDPNEFEKVARSRRSTRAYADDRVPESVMQKCLELALVAPNSSNLQPWEFYWVREPAKKKQLAEFCLSQPAATTAQELVVCVARLDTWERNRQLMVQELKTLGDDVPATVFQYYNKVVPLAYNQGPLYLFGPIKRLLLKLLAIKKPMPRGPASKADMRVWAHKSTALACQNLMLALRAYGFDSCPMEGMDEVRIRRLLELPRKAEVCMVISAGKRAEQGIYGPQLRLDRSLFVFEI